MIPPAEALVCAEPKLFVGGIGFDIDREAVASHFGQFGPLRDCALLKHADSGKSKGCAMVLFKSWAHAEAAVLSENGAMNHLSGPRQLIVKFADPQRRPEDGVVVGVTPRKLFVGQLPREATVEQLRPVFEGYGDIVELSVMPPKREGGMGCAFITYATWAAAEAAMQGVDGQLVLPGAAHAASVKLADAKPVDASRVGSKRGIGDAVGGGGMAKRQLTGAMGSAVMGGGGFMMGGPMLGYSMGGMMGMPGMQQGYGMPGMGMPGMQQGYGMPGMGMPGMQQGYGMSGMGMPGMQQGYGMPGLQSAPGMQQNGPPTTSGAADGAALPPGIPGTGYGTDGTGAAPGAAAPQMLAQPPLAQLPHARPPLGQPSLAQLPALGAGAASSSGSVGGMAGGLTGGLMGGGMMGGGMMGGGMMAGGMMGGMTPSGACMVGSGMGSAMMAGGRLLGGAAGGRAAAPMDGASGSAALAAAKSWKLFLGQVSYDLSEADLFPFFSQFGNILELALLRLPDGRNKGCGFLTYSSQAEAEAAMAHANGFVMPNDPRGRPLTVKLAQNR